MFDVGSKKIIVIVYNQQRHRFEYNGYAYNQINRKCRKNRLEIK